jgi:hypothetical protein
MQGIKEIGMVDRVYDKLREHLDSLPMGFPKTESGVEIRLLKKLFSEEAAGLVPSPANAQSVGGMCSCCSCCCELLTAIKLDARPSRKVKSNYLARVDGEICTG